MKTPMITTNVTAADALINTAGILELSAKRARALANASDYYLLCALQGVTASERWRLPRGDTPRVLYDAINCGAIKLVASSQGFVHLIAATPPYEDIESLEQAETALKRWEQFIGGGEAGKLR